jgi:hypothetical protein
MNWLAPGKNRLRAVKRIMGTQGPPSGLVLKNDRVPRDAITTAHNNAAENSIRATLVSRAIQNPTPTKNRPRAARRIMTGQKSFWSTHKYERVARDAVTATHSSPVAKDLGYLCLTTDPEPHRHERCATEHQIRNGSYQERRPINAFHGHTPLSEYRTSNYFVLTKTLRCTFRSFLVRPRPNRELPR